jgi:myo-inositol-1(or 4)-monophosphatase
MAAPPSDRDLATSAARKAGAIAMGSFRGTLAVRHKAPDQPLTDADVAIDVLLHRLLAQARPAYGWLSEESVDRPDRLARARVWVVDPIDGTRSYIAGRREFSISIGLAEDGDAVVGVVHNPATGELYRAERGEGAFRQDTEEDEPARLHVATPSARERPVLLASRSEIAAAELAPFADRFEIRPCGSTAYKLALVAAGAADAFLSRGPKSEWDVCAGALLVQEAGGRVTDLAGRPLRFNRPQPFVQGILATRGDLHDTLLAALASLPPTPRMTRAVDD